MLFSVIVPMYNASNYIRECIDSVLAQTQKDFELIIINDGSTDDCGAIADEYEKVDKRIKVIHQNNMGLFKVRCVGVNTASGKYIVFLDADDRLKVNALDRIANAFDSGRFDMIIYSAETFGEKKKGYPFKKLFDSETKFENESKKALYLKILFGHSLNNMCLKAIKRECFDVSELMDYPKITMGEDLLHSLRPLTNAKRIKYINDILYEYRIISSSMTRNFQTNVYEGSKFIHLEIKKFLKRWKMESKEEETLYYKRFLKSIGVIVLYSPANITDRKKEYLNTLNLIRNDEMFVEAYQQAYKNQSFIYKLPLFLLKNGFFSVLYRLKLVVTNLRNLRVN
ncbi:glycosyltransferase family 2 protein [Fictibacillus enclensis]|uniref:glycosyltransferase family 2 protein n=1 Tax=Fictibacillus enclensis TaxID=1017270 RepID=UPI0025A29180|nr:glycosyltransferase family 2 protein [Fictibacillus enclensis]MDM5201141.1 glycosyltransferase family 2 protein [Fictibacillus enclensis]